MILLIALATALLVWWLLDQPSPAAMSRTIEERQLLPLSELEAELVARRLRDELDAEARTGRGDGAWDEVRHARALADARRQKSGQAHQTG
jgi:hypothetical protein